MKDEIEAIKKKQNATVLDIVNADLSKGQQDLIKTVENINSLADFVYKKDFKDSNEELTQMIEDLVNYYTKSYIFSIFI